MQKEKTMVGRKILNLITTFVMITSLFGGVAGPVQAQVLSTNTNSTSAYAKTQLPADEIGSHNGMGKMRSTTQAMRTAVASRQTQSLKGINLNLAGLNPTYGLVSPLTSIKNSIAKGLTKLATMAAPLSPPDYFGVANWTNSPLPQLDANGAVVPNTGIRKFVDTLPGLCGISPWGTGGANSLGQCIPVATPDTTTFPGADYYEIALVEYREQMHPDLPATGTEIRGYVQIVPLGTTGAVPLTMANGLTKDILDSQGNQVYGATKPHYLGPLIIAKGCELNSPGCNPTPVRVKFTNYLPTGPAGDLFIPVDPTYMGAGMGPGGSIKSINVSNGGSGYTSPPSIVFNNTGTGGTGAAAVANVSNGVLLSVLVTNGGSGYSSAPTISFSGGGTGAAAAAVLAGQPGEMFTENRATLHLHGGNTPWISDGTPHQWTTPQGELTSYSRGASVSFVPDMWFDANGNLLTECAGLLTCATAGATNDPGLGSLTFYWTNQESGRLLFYHDHAYGITRLNVYAGEAAGYLITDPAEEDALAAANIPGTIGSSASDLNHLVPLIIQDKTFVPDNGDPGGYLAATDPTWDVAKYGGAGNLWLPHVWMPNQNPADIMGANAYGRWDYGPWFWPPQDPSTFVPSGQPYPCDSVFYQPPNPAVAFPPLMCPGIPNPSGIMEGMMDTPVINGAAYPTLTVDPTSYRFQVLSVGNDRTFDLQLYVADPLSVAVTNGGSGYTSAPTVGFSGGGGSGATATATMSTGSVTSLIPTNVGAGYTFTPTLEVPNVVITGDGTGATATASMDSLGHIASLNVTNIGTGYTFATVVIDPPMNCGALGQPGVCEQATADAVVTPSGTVLGVVVTNPGSGWTSAPTVTFTGGGGTGAAAIASIDSEVKMVDAVPHSPNSALPLCSTPTETGGGMLAMAALDANGNPINGTGLPANCWPTSWPTDGRDGGVPDPLTAGPAIVQIGTESGVLPSPVVIPSTPVGYEYNRKSITVLNVFTHGLVLGPAERADIVVDFSKFAGKTLLLYNDAPAPVPAFDPRNDYYTGDPDQTSSGGAPSTLPGYGPNTRTLMQIKVNAAAGTPLDLAPLDTALPNIFATQQNQMNVPEPAFPAGNGNAAQPTYARIQDTSMTGWFGTPVGSLTLTDPGSGYSAAPLVGISGGGGSGATALANFIGATVNAITLTASGSGYTSAPTVVFNNTGTNGSGAAASALFTRVVSNIQMTNVGSGYVIAPTITIAAPPAGGVRATALATITNGSVSGITITNPGSGYTSVPSVTFSNPPPGGTRARGTAVLTGIVQSLVLTNGGSGYTSAPTVSFSGGGGSGAAAIAGILPGTITGLTLTNPGTGYTSAPTVVFTGTNTTPAVAVAVPVTTDFYPKAIQELFTLDYGRMNATLGVEVPFTNFFTQTTIPYGYVDPPTEIFQSGDMQIWKITHNGVDTHLIHFHLFDVQVINRVGWDGMIKPPDPNEVGWKDTVRMNPLEDIIVALRPMKQTLPFELPNSVRTMDVTEPIGASNANNTPGFANIDTANQPAPVTNALVNFGWEYVWHCHILSHEEIDMMRPMAMAVPPDPPLSVTAVRQGSGNNQRVSVTWVDNSINETGFAVERATSLAGPWFVLTQAPAAPGTGTTLAFTDSTVARRTSYYYRVTANNVVGYDQAYAAPAVGYPTVTASSVPVNAPAAITTLAPTSEAPIFADSFETGLTRWSGAIGSVGTAKKAVVGPYGGELGMAVSIGNGAAQVKPSYVFDLSPENEVMYDGNFYFNPNGATTSGSPVDIFTGLDQYGQPTFGVQFQGDSSSAFKLRAWVMQNGEKVFTGWDTFTPEPNEDPEDITNVTHKIDVAWTSGSNAGFSLYIDDYLFASLNGNTSAYKLDEVLLGPSMGLPTGASGTMYFDEFTSSRLSGVSYAYYFAVMSNP
jgi:FtsP/CotA-like multicopper oxidase with cupredoxin domain